MNEEIKTSQSIADLLNQLEPNGGIVNDSLGGWWEITKISEAMALLKIEEGER